MNMNNETLAQLAFQAEQSFVQQNIEKFVTEFTTIEDVEIMAITACWLNIGIRNEGFNCALWAYNKFKEDASPLQYVLNKSQNYTRFQYFYTKFTSQHTLHDWWMMMGKLYKIYSSGSTLLAEVRSRVSESDEEDYRIAVLQALIEIFDGVKGMPNDASFIPNKFVRFVMMMVRPRPTGAGVWADAEPELFSPASTFIPLNNELLKAISENEILESPSMTWEFAKSLIEYFANIFPDDPARGYFTLLGLHYKLPIINQ